MPSSSFASLLLNHREMISKLRLRHSILGSAHCAVVGLDGLEPSTSRLSGARSSHLSYRPVSSFGFLVQSSVTACRKSEPLTRTCSSCWTSRDLQLQQFSYHGFCRYPKIGGDEGNRTLDPLLAGQVLSQLSYTPIKSEK